MFVLQSRAGVGVGQKGCWSDVAQLRSVSPHKWKSLFHFLTLTHINTLWKIVPVHGQHSKWEVLTPLSVILFDTWWTSPFSSVEIHPIKLLRSLPRMSCPVKELSQAPIHKPPVSTCLQSPLLFSGETPGKWPLLLWLWVEVPLRWRRHISKFEGACDVRVFF